MIICKRHQPKKFINLVNKRGVYCDIYYNKIDNKYAIHIMETKLSIDGDNNNVYYEISTQIDFTIVSAQRFVIEKLKMQMTLQENKSMVHAIAKKLNCFSKTSVIVLLDSNTW